MSKSRVRVPEPVLIALGANLGDPLATLDAAMRKLRQQGGLLRASSPWRTAPMGGPAGQPDYINAVALLNPPENLAEPRRLLDWLLELERSHGRERTERWSARTLDLDLLAYGTRAVSEAGLELPHPRLQERAFVLAPLAELWPDWTHPDSDGVTARELLDRLDTAGVTRLPARW